MKGKVLEKAAQSIVVAPTVISWVCEEANNELLWKAFGESEKTFSDIASLRSVYDYGGGDLKLLEGISRLEAYRLFASLPLPLYAPTRAEQAPSHITNDEVFGVQTIYAFTAAYLISWELEIVLRVETVEHLEPAHDRALVSERRYQMIRRMCELDFFETPNPAMQWILAEASECLLGLRAGEELTTDRKRYDRQGQYIRGLKGRLQEEDEHPWPENFEEELKHYSRWIDAKARAFSEEETTAGKKFKAQYYTPYLNALTTWNSNQWNKYRNRLEGVGLTKKRPGPRLGRKYAK